MTIEVSEKWESRDLVVSDAPSADLLFLAKGTDDSSAAATAVLGVAPPLWNLSPLKSLNVGRLSEDAWEVKVHYDSGGGPKKDDDTFTYSFDTTGGHVRIFQSLETVHSYPELGQLFAPEFNGAIGVTDTAVEGCEIDVPVYNWSETWYVPAANVTGAYKAGIFALIAKTNDAAFRGFQRGEVLFRGARGSLRKADQLELAFNFSASQNVTNRTIGTITGIDKRGWEYIWCRYEKRKDDKSKRMVTVPIAVYVERVPASGGQ